jgi:pyruvate/2-oxoglutarate dehydrogenase complex dihydrolipoamide dehydrogenase (E3) component
MNNNAGLPESCSVAIVGGGTAGLALAAELRRQGIDNVVVLEREKNAGGIPRHCGHYPFGIWEYGKLLKGPDYAKKNVETAAKLGVRIFTETSVTALHPNGKLSFATRSGQSQLQAKRVVLSTGVRESSRAQRFIGGDRPLGVITTGALQSMVYLQGIRPFRHPVIFGSELVSFSAISTCRHLGINPVAMVEENDRIIARRVVQPYLTLKGVPLFAGVRSPKIIGSERVEAIEFTDASSNLKNIETDGIIISGRFRPESALLRMSHLEVDPRSGGPVIDQFGQCTDPTYYSTGNLLGPAETSSWCWQEGVKTAKRIAQELSGPQYDISGSVQFKITDQAIAFVVPQRLTLSERPRGMTQMQVELGKPAKGFLEAVVGGKSIWKGRIDSRPMRRILMPLDVFLQSKTDQLIEFSIS